MARHIVDVLVPVALDKPYSYRVPAGIELAPGDLVRVPLGPREATGAVWGEGVARPGLDNRLKDVAEKLGIPPLRRELRSFIEWVAGYTLSSRGMVLRKLIADGGYAVTLLDGVTGSGKTEVYFEAIAETIRRGHQTLVLMPEIALTARFLDRFAERFGVRPAEWHSGLSPRLRARTWSAAASGEIQVVAGARSALFLP